MTARLNTTELRLDQRLPPPKDLQDFCHLRILTVIPAPGCATHTVLRRVERWRRLALDTSRDLASLSKHASQRERTVELFVSNGL